ncbi:MAG: hypothetical protein IKT40_03240 [Bacilli bacterium]|nr:hypothetical protein [Bacilli bacterium]
MKFTNEDLLKAMGLEVGDLIKIKWDFGNSNFRYYRITKDFAFQNIQTETKEHISVMVGNCEYEKIKHSGTYGNARCQIQIDCRNCPLKFFTHEESNNRGLRIKEVWNKLTQYWAPDFIMKSNGFTKEMQKNVEQKLDQYIVDEKLRNLVEQDEEQIEEGEK